MAGASDAREKTQEEDREETVGADAGENPNEGNDLLAEAKEQDGAAEAGAGKEAAQCIGLKLTDPAPLGNGRSGETVAVGLQHGSDNLFSHFGSVQM